MTEETIAPAETMLAQWVDRDAVPDGYWIMNDHFSVPVPPLYADLSCTVIPRARQITADEFSLFAPPEQTLVIDGYWYGGTDVQPVAPSPELVAAFEEKVRTGHEQLVLRRWHEERRPAAQAELRRITALDLAAMPDSELLAHIRDLDRVSLSCWIDHARDGYAASLVMGRFGLFCRERLGMADPEIIALLAGASRSSSEPMTALESLAAVAAASPALREALRSAAPWGDERVRSLLRPYLDAYGHRTLDFALDRPTLAERPQRAVRLLVEAIDRAAVGSAGLAQADTSSAAATGARERFASEDRDEFDRLLAEARAAYGVRDDDVTFVMWSRGVVRYALLEAGRRLAGRSVLPDPERIWYLRWPEIEAALAGDAADDLSTRSEARLAEHRRQQAEGPPPAIIGVPFAPAARPRLSPPALQALRAAAWARDLMRAPAEAEPGAAERQVRGIGGSAGMHTGRARVLISEDQFDLLEAGDVLVCSYTSPSWTIVYGTIGAVVADEGGLLSHAAITAREYGIPAVVGSKTGTRAIPDGALVTVDGARGVVSIDDV